MKAFLIQLIKFSLTLVMVILAFFAGRKLWIHYEVEPWTRDGRVRADVVLMAPDVSGLVTKVAVKDNQLVKAGDLLFEIDTVRFELAQQQAEAVLKAAQVARNQAARDTQRNQSLGNLVSAEVLEQSQMKLKQADATVAQAQIQQQMAVLNAERSHIRAANDGVVTNLDLRMGEFATAGKPALALVNLASFYIEGYFEETKLKQIHIGDVADIRLMGDSRHLTGHVESISAGIADRDRVTSNNLLVNVNPNLNWVRLAQRIPVRIKLDVIPGEMRLVSGQTATVSIINKELKQP